MGAWIETCLCLLSFPFLMSLPAWKRGLKRLKHISTTTKGVAPRVGAWIETWSRCTPVQAQGRSPRGSVDWNCNKWKRKADGSGLIVPSKTVSNVPPAAETNAPPSMAISRSFFRNHDYLCDVKPRQIIYRGEIKCPFDSENRHRIRERTLPNRKGNISS